MVDKRIAIDLQSFIQHLAKIKPRQHSINTFRGQRNGAWLDGPALLRAPAKLLPFEYNAVRDLRSVHPQEFYQDENMFDRLVRMQHYGLPTRLLDVTSNPLVALYFATEPYRSKSGSIDGQVIAYDVPKIRRKYFDSDSVSCAANLANLTDEEKQSLLEAKESSIGDFNQLDACDRLVQFIRVDNPAFRPRINPVDLSRSFYVVPKMLNRRIIAQHGAFIIFGLEVLRVSSSGRNDTIKKQRISIPQDNKAGIRKELDSLGINNGTLFPELERAAVEIVRRYTQ